MQYRTRRTVIICEATRTANAIRATSLGDHAGSLRRNPALLGAHWVWRARRVARHAAGSAMMRWPTGGKGRPAPWPRAPIPPAAPVRAGEAVARGAHRRRAGAPTFNRDGRRSAKKLAHTGRRHDHRARAPRLEPRSRPQPGRCSAACTAAARKRAASARGARTGRRATRPGGRVQAHHAPPDLHSGARCKLHARGPRAKRRHARWRAPGHPVEAVAAAAPAASGPPDHNAFECETWWERSGDPRWDHLPCCGGDGEAASRD